MNRTNIDNKFWTKENSLKLIDEYRRRPVLWYQKDPMFMNETFKNEAWIDIGNTMGIDHNMCIMQMTDLLLQYDVQKTRFQEGLQTDWFAWNALTFLYFTNYEKLKLVTGNHYYNEEFETEIRKLHNKFTMSSDKPADLDELDKELKLFVTENNMPSGTPGELEELKELEKFAEEVVTKMRKYPTEIRNRIKQTIGEVFLAADEECHV